MAKELPTASEAVGLKKAVGVDEVQGETSGRKAASNTLNALTNLLATRICPWFVGVQPPSRSNVFYQ